MEPICPQEHYSEDRRPGWNQVVHRTTTVRTGEQETWVEWCFCRTTNMRTGDLVGTRVLLQDYYSTVRIVVLDGAKMSAAQLHYDRRPGWNHGARRELDGVKMPAGLLH